MRAVSAHMRPSRRCKKLSCAVEYVSEWDLKRGSVCVCRKDHTFSMPLPMRTVMRLFLVARMKVAGKRPMLIHAGRPLTQGPHSEHRAKEFKWARGRTS